VKKKCQIIVSHTIAHDWIMYDHKALEESKGSGKAMIGNAHKLAKIVWYKPMSSKEFDPSYMRG